MPAEPSRVEFKYLIERQREEIRTLMEVSRLSSAAADAQEVVRKVASYLNRAFPVSLCGTLLLERKKLLLICFSKISPMDASRAAREICGEENPEQVVEDLSGTPGLRSEAAGLLRSSHFAPMVFNGKPMGRLAVFSAKPGAFSKEDGRVIDLVADQLAAVLHSALLMDELRQADLMKDELLAIISHELRIPLTSVQEGTRLLLEGALGEISSEQKDFLGTILRNSERLQGLVEEVELAAKLITGRITYSFAAAPLPELLRQVTDRFQALAESRGVALSLGVIGPSVSVNADAKLLPAALDQLVENGLQATERGDRVTVEVSEQPDQVVIRITDTGRGIPPEHIPKLFGKFFTAAGTGDRKTSGLGLGLFTARKIVEAHRGEVRLESQVGRGTSVTVILPRSRG